MSNQHTVNHNDSFTFAGAYRNNSFYERAVEAQNRAFDDARITPIPWKQYHRANVPHLTRHSM